MSPNKTYPLISIITLNYNQLKVTCEFIESAMTLTYPNYEIIVVDNASLEDPRNTIESLNPDVRVIRNKVNLGFSGGNNVGIRASKGEYLFIVNNDTEVTPGLLGKLIQPFYANPDVGAVSPKIRYFSDPNIIQYAGFSPINPYTGRNKTIGCKQEDAGQFDVSGYTAYAHGAAMMVKREVLEKAGLMPEIFFIYYEELDWSMSIRKAGYKIYYQAEGLIYHKESMTMGKESLMKTYFFNRNRILFMRRNTSPAQFSLFLIIFLLMLFPAKVFRYLMRFQFKHLVFFLKGLMWHFKGNGRHDLYLNPTLTPVRN